MENVGLILWNGFRGELILKIKVMIPTYSSTDNDESDIVALKIVSELRYLSSFAEEYVQLHINIYIDAYQYHRVKDVTSFDVVIRCFMSLDFRLFDQFRYTVIKYYRYYNTKYSFTKKSINTNF